MAWGVRQELPLQQIPLQSNEAALVEASLLWNDKKFLAIHTVGVSFYYTLFGNIYCWGMLRHSSYPAQFVGVEKDVIELDPYIGSILWAFVWWKDC